MGLSAPNTFPLRKSIKREVGSGEICLAHSAQLFFCFLYLLSAAPTSRAPVASRGTSHGGRPLPPTPAPGLGFPSPSCVPARCMVAVQPAVVGTGVGHPSLPSPAWGRGASHLERPVRVASAALASVAPLSQVPHITFPSTVPTSSRMGGFLGPGKVADVWTAADPARPLSRATCLLFLNQSLRLT